MKFNKEMVLKVLKQQEWAYDDEYAKLIEAVEGSEPVKDPLDTAIKLLTSWELHTDVGLTDADFAKLRRDTNKFFTNLWVTTLDANPDVPKE